ncbi:hypothetical protein B0H14DRAFT_1646269 [Mycena olivaceomarginata]|nr:hypothetical protein B0H14DRAFT_1646269 [Mycena olivaceomarginata]
MLSSSSSAVDEHPKPRDQLLEFLTGLLIKYPDCIRLLVSSRDEPDIRVAMEKVTAAEVDLNRQLKQNEDMCKYITEVLQSRLPFRTWKDEYPSTVQRIKHRLFKESMFRLVALQLDELVRVAPIDVDDTLKNLPGSLVEIYDRTLRSLQSTTAQRVMKCSRSSPAHPVLSVSTRLRKCLLSNSMRIIVCRSWNSTASRILQRSCFKCARVHLSG